MKFTIRYADKIVGILTIIAVLFLIAAIFFLGNRQRWFETKHSYFTTLDSASGVSENMPILYKGFTIGNVDSIELVNSVELENPEDTSALENAVTLPQNDVVKVSFHIFEEYIERVKKGSLVNVNISPIGLGNQFQFYPGLGDPLEENTLIPIINSYEGRQLMADGLTLVNEGEDGLSAIIAQVSDLLQNLNFVLLDAGDAIIGTDATALGRIVGGLDETIASVSGVLTNVNSITSQVDNDLSPILQEIQYTVSSLNEKLSDPDGMLSSLLESDGAMLTDIEDTLDSLSGTLNNIEKISGTQAGGLIEDLRVTIGDANKVLESLKNNPLLKKGFTEDVSAESGGNSPRNIDF
jgi:phospholipid/cholesterol/gamma-HCH transport system substrate-binding protein